MKLLRTLFFFVALFGLCASAQAVTSFCVKTSQDLQLDLSLASSNKGDNVIKIVRSATPYTLTTVNYFETYGALSVLGGYDVNCNTRIIDPANTVIDFAGTSAFFSDYYAPSNSLMQFDGLTLQNGSNIEFSVGSYNCCIPDEAGNLRVTNTRLTNFHWKNGWMDSNTGTVAFDGTSAHMLLSNVLIDHVVQTGATACAVSMDAEGSSLSQLSYVTVDLSGGKSFCLLTDELEAEGGTFHTDIYNSIFWDSDGGNAGLLGVRKDGPIEVNLVNDIFHSYLGDGSVTSSSPLAPQQSDPLWVDAANGDYHLAKSLPGGAANAAVNTGVSVVPFGFTNRDIEGSSRPIGSHPDRGAYESPYTDTAVFTVTNTSDCSADGCGSLRAAMIAANNSVAAATTVNFAIPGGACPAVIDVGSPLPDVKVPMLIDGYSQAGSSKNTDPYGFNAMLCVVVEPGNSGAYHGFGVPQDPAGSNASLTLTGVGVGAFPVGVELFGGADHQIIGNQFGGYIDNFTYQLYGATVAAVYANSTNGKLIIGGDEAATRNVFLNAQSFGPLPAAAVLVGPAVDAAPGDCQIDGNTIGFQDDGSLAGKNSDYGIYLYGNGCRVHGNAIAGVFRDAINFDAAFGGGNGNTVQNNTIALSGDAGIRIAGSHNVIGAPIAPGAIASTVGNIIEFIDGPGVVVAGNGYGNTIRGNSIYANGASLDAMSVDLGGNGPTLNDISDSDAGPNDLQNFPVVHGILWSGVPQSGGTATLTGQLRTFPGDYQIDAYYAQGCDAAGRGIAQTWIGSLDDVQLAAQVYTTAFSVSVAVPAYDPGIGALSVTATNTTNGEGSTSELSACVPVDTIFRAGLED